jgi:hypothetical protein
MRTKAVNAELGIKQVYKYYRSKDYTTKDEKVLYEEFKSICYAVNKRLAEKILEGNHVKLPFNLGDFYIKKVKNNYKHLKYDYGHYNKTGEKIYHLNAHSKKYHAKWFWRKINCRIPGHIIYSFIPSRGNKRNLATIMKRPDGYKKYLE